MRVRPAGPRAVLLDCADPVEVAAWHRELHRRRAAGTLVAAELVPAARTVLVDGVADPAALADALSGQPLPPTDAAADEPLAEPAADPRSAAGPDADPGANPVPGSTTVPGPSSIARPGSGGEPGEVELACVYDGPDLAAVAELWHTSVEEVVARHTGTEFRVAFCGFSPGFGYLTGLPPELAVPRRDSPRPRVPAGAVGLAGEYSGVYPSPSPGGWRLIGHTDAVLFDPSAAAPALLSPGTRVRFRAVRG